MRWKAETRICIAELKEQWRATAVSVRTGMWSPAACKIINALLYSKGLARAKFSFKIRLSMDTAPTTKTAIQKAQTSTPEARIVPQQYGITTLICCALKGLPRLFWMIHGLFLPHKRCHRHRTLSYISRLLKVFTPHSSIGMFKTMTTIRSCPTI
jgi:hypothetical protein